MDQLRLEVRLSIKELLIENGKLEDLKTSHPRFFQARWFKRPSMPVIKGKISQKK